MLFVGIGLSIVGYVGMHAFLRSDELDVLVGIMKGKLRRVATNTERSR
jgi:putative peptidoglycan lipid II flippase